MELRLFKSLDFLQGEHWTASFCRRGDDPGDELGDVVALLGREFGRISDILRVEEDLC